LSRGGGDRGTHPQDEGKIRTRWLGRWHSASRASSSLKTIAQNPPPHLEQCPYATHCDPRALDGHPSRLAPPRHSPPEWQPAKPRTHFAGIANYTVGITASQRLGSSTRRSGTAASWATGTHRPRRQRHLQNVLPHATIHGNGVVGVVTSHAGALPGNGCADPTLRAELHTVELKQGGGKEFRGGGQGTRRGKAKLKGRAARYRMVGGAGSTTVLPSACVQRENWQVHSRMRAADQALPTK